MGIKHLGGRRYQIDYSIRQPDGSRKRLIKIIEGKRNAVAELEGKRTKVREGEYSGPVRTTITQAAAIYLVIEKSHGAVQTYLMRKTHIDRYIVPTFGGHAMSSLTWQEIEEKAADWTFTRQHGEDAEYTPLSIQTRQKVFQTLNRIYKIVGKKLGLRYNPMIHVDTPREENTFEELVLGDGVMVNVRSKERSKGETLRRVRKDEVLSADECSQLIFASHAGIERIRHMILLGAGLRLGEALGLKWQYVDLDMGEIDVQWSLTQVSDKHLGDVSKAGRGKMRHIFEKPKTKRAKPIPIGKMLVSELKRWKLECPKDEYDLVLPNLLGKPADRKTVWKQLRAACVRAKITPIAANNLRHTYASQMLMSGRTPLEVAGLMGHENVHTTLTVYANWCDREKSTAADALEARLFGDKR